MQRLAIGIDIGGQSSKCGVVTEDGTILYQSVVTSLIDNFDEYLDLLAGTVKDLVRKTADRGVAVGIGGILPIVQNKWGRSSAGRAFGSHPRGREFNPLRLHQK